MYGHALMGVNGCTLNHVYGNSGARLRSHVCLPRPTRNERINHTLGERVKRRNRRTGISPSALPSQPRRCAVMKQGEHWLHARFIDHVDNLAITRHRDGLDTQRYGLR